MFAFRKKHIFEFDKLLILVFSHSKTATRLYFFLYYIFSYVAYKPLQNEQVLH